MVLIPDISQFYILTLALNPLKSDPTCSFNHTIGFGKGISIFLFAFDAKKLLKFLLISQDFTPVTRKIYYKFHIIVENFPDSYNTMETLKGNLYNQNVFGGISFNKIIGINFIANENNWRHAQSDRKCILKSFPIAFLTKIQNSSSNFSNRFIP